MGDEDRGSKAPEKLSLPDLAPATDRVPFEQPYFTILENEKQAFANTYQANRRSLRLERIKKLEGLRKSHVIVYYSVDILSAPHAETLFDLLQGVKPQKRLDLFLLSPGGYADPAFKMARLCRDFATDNFGILIPFYAKSAATLLCLGSDELVMGSASEIGPTDPRISVQDEFGRNINISATAVEDALRVIEEHSGGDPQKAFKFMPLIEKINLFTLGEYRRARESSKQYAKELLTHGKLLKDKQKCNDVAKQLAEEYFSHGYPIGLSTAKSLGLNVTEATGEMWTTMWQLHNLYKAMMADSRDGKTMVTTIFEAADFTFAIPTPQ